MPDPDKGLCLDEIKKWVTSVKYPLLTYNPGKKP